MEKNEKKEETLAVTDIEIPFPMWMSAVPLKGGVLFGKHCAQIENPVKKLISKCSGALELCAVGKDKIQNLSRGEPIEIKCRQCGFRHSFAENWKEAVIEWMRIALSIAIDTICNEPEKENYFVNSAQQIKVCIPDYMARMSYVPLLENGLSGERRVLIWQEYGIAVFTKINFDLVHLKALVIDSAILMTDLEELFQNAIKKSAQLAASASERYHFSTRRIIK